MNKATVPAASPAGSLFPEPKPRDRHGRFATTERAYADRCVYENQRLRIERDKYYRAFLATSQRASRLERELQEIKSKLKGML